MVSSKSLTLPGWLLDNECEITLSIYVLQGQILFSNKVEKCLEPKKQG